MKRQRIQIDVKEIDEMIATVDKNEDWKISYSEFRVRFCGRQIISCLQFLVSQTFSEERAMLLQEDYFWFWLKLQQVMLGAFPLVLPQFPLRLRRTEEKWGSGGPKKIHEGTIVEGQDAMLLNIQKRSIYQFRNSIVRFFIALFLNPVPSILL